MMHMRAGDVGTCELHMMHMRAGDVGTCELPLMIRLRTSKVTWLQFWGMYDYHPSWEQIFHNKIPCFVPGRVGAPRAVGRVRGDREMGVESHTGAVLAEGCGRRLAPPLTMWHVGD